MNLRLKGYKLSDYFDFTFCTSGINRKVRIVSPVLILIIWMAFITDRIFYFSFLSLFRTEIKVLSAIGLLVFFVVSFTSYRIFMAFKSQKYLNNETTIELTKDTIIEKSAFTSLNLPTTEITKIIISNNTRLYIYYENYRAILICKNSLEDKNIWNELLSFIYDNYNCDNFVIKKM